MQELAYNTRQLKVESAALCAVLESAGRADDATSLRICVNKLSDRVISPREVSDTIASVKQGILLRDGPEAFGPGSEYQLELRIGMTPKPEGVRPQLDHNYLSTTALFRTPEMFLPFSRVVSSLYPDGTTILSLGCSTGKESIATAAFLAAHSNNAFVNKSVIFGADLNEKAVAQAESGYFCFDVDDLRNARKAGLSIQQIQSAFFQDECDAHLHPLGRVLDPGKSLGLTQCDLAAKEHLVGDAARPFSESSGTISLNSLAHLTRPARPLSLCFEEKDVVQMLQEHAASGPLVVMARNVIYHLRSSNGYAALMDSADNIPSNAPLLLKHIPTGSLLVLGDTDIAEPRIQPVLQAQGFSSIEDSPYLFIRR